MGRRRKTEEPIKEVQKKKSTGIFIPSKKKEEPVENPNLQVVVIRAKTADEALEKIHERVNDIYYVNVKRKDKGSFTVSYKVESARKKYVAMGYYGAKSAAQLAQGATLL